MSRQLGKHTPDDDDEERSQRRCELMLKVHFTAGKFQHVPKGCPPPPGHMHCDVVVLGML